MAPSLGRRHLGRTPHRRGSHGSHDPHLHHTRFDFTLHLSFQIFQMILASKVIKHYKGLAKVPLEAVEEDYDDKPLPPVPPHQAPGAVLGARYGRGTGGGHGSLRNESCPLNIGFSIRFHKF